MCSHKRISGWSYWTGINNKSKIINNIQAEYCLSGTTKIMDSFTILRKNEYYIDKSLSLKGIFNGKF